MVRVYSNAGRGANDSLGGMFAPEGQLHYLRGPTSSSSPTTRLMFSPSSSTSPPSPCASSYTNTEPKAPLHLGLCKKCRQFYRRSGGRQAAAYDDLLQQARKEEQHYRAGSGPLAGEMRNEPSDIILRRREDTGLQDQLDSLSNAGTLQQENDPYSSSFSYAPEKENYNSGSPRKTWSAPNKDPFGNDLEDPFKRSHSQGRSHGSYQPSAAGSGAPRRGGGYDQASYMKDQMEDQRQRRRRGDQDQVKDWWEKSEPNVPQYKGPHPNQEQLSSREHHRKADRQPGHHRPDPGTERKRYEQELRDQMESKRRSDEEQKRKEREEEEKLDRRLKEQQERMQKELDDEANKKRAKEEGKLRRQEELMRRQAELQKEMAQQKKEEAERKLAEKRGGKAPRSSRAERTEEEPQGIKFRSDSPPVPTIRNRSPEKKSNGRGDDEVVEQFANMRQGLEKRQKKMSEEDSVGGAWDGLAEI